jgi:hypothetical protein
VTQRPPATPGPLVGWVAPVEPEGLGFATTARDGWRLTRAHLATFASIALIPTIILNLLTVPMWVSTGRMFEQMIRFWITLDVVRYRDDPYALQRDMQTALQPAADLTVLGTVTTGIGFMISIFVTAALTAATLDAANGRRPSFKGAYVVLRAQAAALVVPAVALALGYVVIFTPLMLNQPSFYGRDAAAGAAGIWLGLAALVGEAIAVYLGVRWSLYFQAVIGEGYGLRRGLSRSAELTSGVRLRIGLIFIMLALVVGFVVALVAGAAGLTLGIATMSILAGLIAYSAVIGMCGLVYLPFFVAVLTTVYRRRVSALAPSAPTADVPAPIVQTAGDAPNS